jgi:hypothetical protein
MRYWEQYQRWKAERNKDRANLEAKYGYDCKHAAHLFRLIGEGIELLTTGQITFPRPSAEDLLAIRHGKYTYDELMARLGDDIDSNFSNIEDKIILPHNPNRKQADKLCQKLVKARLNLK